MRKLMALAAAASLFVAFSPGAVRAQKTVTKPVVTKEQKAPDVGKMKSASDVAKQKLDVTREKAVLAKQKRDESIANGRHTPKPNKGDKDERVSDRRDRANRDADDDVFRGSLRGNGNGPRFCRTGEGHPVYGRQWCVQKGFGLGDATWDRASWNDVIFRAPQRTDLQLGRGSLLDVLGDVVLNRLDARRRTFGISSPLAGRWLGEDDRSVLLITAGGVPLAELVDANHDRRADLVLLNFRR